MVLLIVVLVLVIGVVIALVVGKVGSDSMSSPTRTSSFELPEDLGARGPDGIRLDQSFRGYNMSQVDAVLDALFEENAQLRAQLGNHQPGNPVSDQVNHGAHVIDDADARNFGA